MKKLLLSFLLFVFAQPTFASNPYQVFHKDRMDINVRANYFKSQSNFGSDGSQQSLLGDNYFQNIDVTSSLRWELIEDLGFIGGFNVAASESADLLTTRKNSTVNRIDIGADYLFWTSSIHETFATIMYSHSLEATALNTDTVSNSDGAAEIQADISTRFNMNGFYPYFQGGLNYRSEGFSTLATYAVGAEFRFSEIGLGASILGKASITDDQYTGTPATRDTVNNRVNGGSKKYFAVNPNSTDLEVNLNFAASEMMLLKFFGGYTLVGSNSALGYNAGVTLNLAFGGSKAHSVRKRSEHKDNLNTISRELTPEDFKEDTNDGVNQDYFKPVAPAQKNYIQQVEGSKQNLQNTTTNDQVSEQEKQNEEVKKQLNNLEYTIKLKQKKKKKKKTGN
jgi:hypothetical protein